MEGNLLLPRRLNLGFLLTVGRLAGNCLRRPVLSRQREVRTAENARPLPVALLRAATAEKGEVDPRRLADNSRLLKRPRYHARTIVVVLVFLAALVRISTTIHRLPRYLKETRGGSGRLPLRRRIPLRWRPRVFSPLILCLRHTFGLLLRRWPYSQGGNSLWKRYH